MPLRSVTPFSKSPSGLPGWTNFLKILLSLVALWKGQSILWVRNIQPSPKVAAFCSERSAIVQNLSKTGNCLNQQTAKSDKMAVALLPPLPVLSPAVQAGSSSWGRVRMCHTWVQLPGWRLFQGWFISITPFIFPRGNRGRKPKHLHAGSLSQLQPFPQHWSQFLG